MHRLLWNLLALVLALKLAQLLRQLIEPSKTDITLGYCVAQPIHQLRFVRLPLHIRHARWLHNANRIKLVLLLWGPCRRLALLSAWTLALLLCLLSLGCCQLRRSALRLVLLARQLLGSWPLLTSAGPWSAIGVAVLPRCHYAHEFDAGGSNLVQRISVVLAAWLTAFIQSPQVRKPASILLLQVFSYVGQSGNLIGPDQRCVLVSACWLRHVASGSRHGLTKMFGASQICLGGYLVVTIGYRLQSWRVIAQHQVRSAQIA